MNGTAKTTYVLSSIYESRFMNIFRAPRISNFFLFLVIPAIAMGMDAPQKSLIIPNQTEFPTLYGTICIAQLTYQHTGFNPVHEPVYYPVKWERNYLKKAGIEVSIYDPCMPVEIEFNNAPSSFDTLRNNPKSGLFLRRSIIPVKDLINLSTKSILRLVLYNHPVELVCEKNPAINNEAFHKQFEIRMKKFYDEPESWANLREPAKEQLIPLGIIIKIKHAPDTVTVLPSGGILTHQNCTYISGPNGLTSDLQLAKQIAKPHDNSMFRHIMNRSTGQKHTQNIIKK
jgi:hypothetical protein